MRAYCSELPQFTDELATAYLLRPGLFSRTPGPLPGTTVVRVADRTGLLAFLHRALSSPLPGAGSRTQCPGSIRAVGRPRR